MIYTHNAHLQAPVNFLLSASALLTYLACLLSVSNLASAQISQPSTAQPMAAQPLPRNTGQTRYGIGLGRLLTSERERSKIDDIRFNVAEQAKAAKAEEEEEAPKLLRIDGITQRPDRPAGQRTSVWINGKVYSESELPYGLTIVRNAKGEVTGLNSVVSKGKIEFAKIGDEITRPQTAAQAQATEFAATQPKKPADQP